MGKKWVKGGWVWNLKVGKPGGLLIGRGRVPAFQGKQEPIREKIIADPPQKQEGEGKEPLPGLLFLRHPQPDHPD